MDRLEELFEEIQRTPSEHRKVLLNIWYSYTGCQYPRIKNKKGKEVDFLKNYKKQKEVKTTNSLDDLINSKRQESNLISNVLYSHEASDVPDPYRKRRKK